MGVVAKIGLFLAKNWKLILYAIGGYLLYRGFKSFGGKDGFSFSDNVSNDVDQNNQAHDVVDNLMQQLRNDGGEFTLTKLKLLDRAADIARALGTLIDATSMFEDEELAERLMINLNKYDFAVIEYLYNNMYTENRNLQYDIDDLMTTEQYNNLKHLFAL